MNESRAGSLALLGGALCLDFANTASGRGGPHHLEHLHRYEHLLMWSQHAGAISADEARRLRRAAARAPRAAARALTHAKHLRDAIYAVCLAVGRCRSVPAVALGILNGAVASATGQRSLVPTKRSFAWQWAEVSDDPASVLHPIALSAADLLLTVDRRRLKQCAGEHCGWLFLDETRSRTRRWCEMRVCGSRAKIRRFRRRRAQRVGSRPKS